MEASFLAVVGALALMISLMVAVSLLARGRPAWRAVALAAEVWAAIAAWLFLLQRASLALGAPVAEGPAGELGDLASRASRLSAGDRAGLAFGLAACLALVAHLMWAIRRETSGDDQREVGQV